MPYTSNSAVPPAAQKLPDEAQSVFRRVFNDEHGKGHGDERAFAVAWSAVKNGWKKVGDAWKRKTKKMAASFAQIMKGQPTATSVSVPTSFEQLIPFVPTKRRARDFKTVIWKEANPISEPQPYAYGASGKRRARTFSQVIAEATRGVDAGMNRFTEQRPDLNSDPYRPDWRGHYLGSDRSYGKFNPNHDPKTGQFSEDVGSAPPAPGEHFTVFRAGKEGETGLAGRNAGNSMGVAAHLARHDDFEKPMYRGQAPTHIHAYDVTVHEPFGPYGLRSGTASESTVVGRQADAGGHVSYSFDSGGYTATHLGSVPLKDIRATLPNGSFDDAGTKAGGAAIRTAEFKKFNPNHDDRGRFTFGTGGSASSLFDRYHNPKVTAETIMAKHGPALVAKVADTEAALRRSVPTNASVAEGGFKNPDGSYTGDRAAIHRQILARIFTTDAVEKATPAVGQKPTVTFLGGRGGSGKSWLTGQNGPASDSNAIVLNSDHIKEMLPGYAGWNAALYHEESTAILDKAETMARDAGLNVVFDATLKSAGPAGQRLAEFQKAGYDAKGYYMFTSPQEAASRALNRFDRGGPNGRYVPVSVVLGSTTNERTFDNMKSSFSDWAIYDNNTLGKSPRLVSKGSH